MTQPLIGIWWSDGKTIAALSHSVAAANTTRVAGRIDSNFAHVEEWPKVAVKLGHSPNEEYFAVPRGRVLWDTRRQCGIIIHGSSTGRKCLEAIARRFHLGVEWESEEDLHYSMGADADRLFDNEE